MVKAFLGMGLLGSNFVTAMLEKGDKVRVWNRSPEKAAALEPLGAEVFATPARAVQGAAVVHVTLKDDQSVDEVLAAAETGLQPGTVIIDHTTTTQEGAIARTAAWKEKGFTYIHAPVFMGPANAREGSGYMLVSGSRAVVEKVSPLLEKMTGQLVDLGPEEGKAAAMKLIGNCFLVAFTAGLRDTFALAGALGQNTRDVGSLFEIWNPAQMLPARIRRMSGGDYSKPSWELSMARKDTGIFIDTVQQQGGHLAIMPAIAALMDEWIAKGFGGNDWNVIAKDVVQ
ncbi:NAD(P)-dependent oxidoreductase [Chitinophaga rhizosphaerae]|uniref:NAD(P)-dependent oxidoreductase n=1 Tax=Chitinophaga rhizosphaerae TaxID=1864947 RepID=UPI001F0BE25F|nr:NAD(P)-dependent oxidoreductase [Chitinophaga rhizosphaerae]